MKQLLNELKKEQNDKTAKLVLQVHTLILEIERLQEQLKEANELLNLYFPKKRINSVCVKPINDYKTKWAVK